MANVVKQPKSEVLGPLLLVRAVTKLEEEMMLRTLLLAAVGSLVWAGQDAIAAPQRNAAVDEIPVVSDLAEVNRGLDVVTVPKMLSYQGRLTDTAGRPVPNGNYTITFRLYTVPSGGTPIWSEVQNGVYVKNGLFAVLLGSVTPIVSVPDGGVLYVAMQVGASELTPRLRMASAAYAYKADTANYALASGAWVRYGSDSVLYTIRQLGIAKGSADNALYGNQAYTHVNLGVACTTGVAGSNRRYATVGGGYGNAARGGWSTVGGGDYNVAADTEATVGGGYDNLAGENYATVAGGRENRANGRAATVGGGQENSASGDWTTAGGGYNNDASGDFATVAGGRDNQSWGDYSFTTGYESNVGSQHSNSAAFNGMSSSASVQTSVGLLSKVGGSFTIDHPLDPRGKILNHFFVEGPEMRNIYDGEAVLDASGRAEVRLPDYFDALNRNPRVQLTGVGTADVYLAEKVSGGRFMIGGRPGTEVYWQVTGERRDMPAEVIRRMVPVEQPKTGELVGRMRDDEFLSGCMEQLVREGKAQGIDFRTAAGRQRYEAMKRIPNEQRK